MDKGLGSVNRVDNPSAAALALLPASAKLLADDGVVRIGLGDFSADELFGLPVGHRHRRIVGLILCHHLLGLKIVHGQTTRLTGYRPGKLVVGC